ncbi:MAG TPA: hypothetical protein VHZ95_13465 [Polyangiales bacterium]|nr:hypothetical protein [Polyangiales bacterium]
MRAIFEQHKSRLARLTIVAGIGVVGSILLRSTPRQVQVVLDLGPSHSNFVELRVAYVQAGEELHGATFSFPNGAPVSIRQSVNLPAGDFEVRTELRPLHGEWLASAAPLHAPSDGPIRIHVAHGSHLSTESR